MMFWTVSLPRKWSIRINLFLAQHAPDRGVQLARRLQVVAERLLDHHAPPVLGVAGMGFVVGQAGMAELLDHRAEEAVGDREVEQAVAAGALFLRELVQMRFQR